MFDKKLRIRKDAPNQEERNIDSPYRWFIRNEELLKGKVEFSHITSEDVRKK